MSASRGRADWHAVHAPWCDPAYCRSHEVRLNGPDLVNGKPDGPFAAILGWPTAFAAREQARQDRFRALVDELLEARR